LFSGAVSVVRTVFVVYLGGAHVVLAESFQTAFWMPFSVFLWRYLGTVFAVFMGGLTQQKVLIRT
jgi:hypothetical protein